MDLITSLFVGPVDIIAGYQILSAQSKAWPVYLSGNRLELFEAG